MQCSNPADRNASKQDASRWPASTPVTDSGEYSKSHTSRNTSSRAQLVRREGYTVISVIDNEAAKAVLPWLPLADLLTGTLSPRCGLCSREPISVVNFCFFIHSVSYV
jgi:hypothetical protein